MSQAATAQQLALAPQPAPAARSARAGEVQPNLARLFLRVLPILLAHPGAMSAAGEFSFDAAEQEHSYSAGEPQPPDGAHVSLSKLLLANQPRRVAAARLQSVCRDARNIVVSARPAIKEDKELSSVRSLIVTGFYYGGLDMPEHARAALRRMCCALARWPLAEDDASEGACLARKAFELVLPWSHHPSPGFESPSPQMQSRMLHEIVWPGLAWPDEELYGDEYEEEEEEEEAEDEEEEAYDEEEWE